MIVAKNKRSFRSMILRLKGKRLFTEYLARLRFFAAARNSTARRGMNCPLSMVNKDWEDNPQKELKISCIRYLYRDKDMVVSYEYGCACTRTPVAHHKGQGTRRAC